MDIFINDKPADITLDTEETLGDVMSGIEQWLSPTGSRIRSISVNGREVSDSSLGEAFCLSVSDIKKLDISVCAWRELATEALADLYKTSFLLGKTAFEERANVISAWEGSSAARFLISDAPDIYTIGRAAFSGEGLSLSDLNIIVEERLREAGDPQGEIFNSEDLVGVIAGRLEELPLDMQTGKDRRAAETMQLFTQMGEKLFRLYFILKSEGLIPETFTISGLPARDFMNKFNDALKELSSAYENKDTVLVGDIAEYELAPRLLSIYEALKNISKPSSPVLSTP